MFDIIAGVPVHPLVVHSVVVLGPLSAVMLVAYALRPSWRVGLRWPTLVLSLIAAASAFAATQSGEALEERVGDPGFEHAEKGELAAIATYVLLGAVIVVLFLLARLEQSARTSAIGVVISVAATAFVFFGVYDAGHSGASSVWKGEVSSSSTPSGEGVDDDD